MGCQKIPAADWAQKLFVDNPKLYLPFLLRDFPSGKCQAKSLSSLFNKFGISKNSRILDFSCGIGRLTIPLLRQGYKVVGYDPSSYYIGMARKLARKEKLTKGIKFLSGQIYDAAETLLLNGEKKFNVILNMSQSFGFGDTDDDILMFNTLLRSANEKTILFVEFQNRDWIIKNFKPYLFYSFDSLDVFEFWEIDHENSRFLNRTFFYHKNAQPGCLKLLLDLEMPQKYYTLYELRGVLKKAGWKLLKCFSSIKAHGNISTDSMMPLSVWKPL